MDQTLVLQKNDFKYALGLSLPFLLFFLLSCYYWEPATAFTIISGVAVFALIFLRPIWGLIFCLMINFSGLIWGLGIKQGFLPVAFLTAAAVIYRKVSTMDFSFAMDRQLLFVAG